MKNTNDIWHLNDLTENLLSPPLLPDGRKRDYRVYSILDSEWPSCKKTLKQYLEKYV